MGSGISTLSSSLGLHVQLHAGSGLPLGTLRSGSAATLDECLANTVQEGCPDSWNSGVLVPPLTSHTLL